MKDEIAEYQKWHKERFGHKGHYCYSTILGSKFLCKMFGNKLTLNYFNTLSQDGASIVIEYCPFCGFTLNRLEKIKWEGK